MSLAEEGIYIKSHQSIIQRNMVLPEISPRPDSFFFVETSGVESLSQMSLCAVESTARHHPNNQIYMVMIADTVLATGLLK